jgi:transcriptional regulator with XRE-family HTH domain
MDAIRRAIASEIRAERGRKNLSQADLIRLSGLSKSTIGRIENAERDVDIAQLVAIGDVLGIAPVTILQRAQDALTRGE